MLSIKDLRARVGEKMILNGLDLDIPSGEVHAIMGPNGSGKSTLAGVLAGREGIEVLSGQVLYKGRDLLALTPELRAREGLFLGFQHPVEIPGVNNLYFIKEAVNAARTHRGLEPLDAIDFLATAKERLKLVEGDKLLMERAVNEGFSGGERKRNEVFQMAMLEPSLAILDEIDSGLDIDALRVLAKGIDTLRSPERSILLITHYQRLLEYIVPDRVHVLQDGKIVESGGRELALTLETRGYRPSQPPSHVGRAR